MKRILYIIIPALLIISSQMNCSKIVVRDDIDSTDDVPGWEMNGSNAQRTNSYQWKLYLPLQLAWDYTAASAVEKTIIAADSVIFFGTKDGRIEAVNIGTGERVGEKKMTHASTCALAGKNLIIARRFGDETLYHYDIRSNDFLWKVEAGDISTEPLVLEDAVVVSSLYNHVDLYELETGTRIWTFETDDQIRSSPAYAHNMVVFGCDDHHLYAVDKANGRLKWKYKTGAPVQSIPGINSKEKVVYIGSLDNHFYALKLETGEKLWDFSAGGKIFNGIAIDDGKVIFGSTDRHLYCLDEQNGDLLWKFSAGSVISTNPVIARDVVIFGSLDGHIYIVSLDSGELLWEYRTKGRIRTCPIVWGELLVCASEDNMVYVFEFKHE